MDQEKYNQYLNFITEHKDDELIENFHKHHIKPHYQGGTNDPDNLVKLTYENHKQAHLMLADCYPDKSTDRNNNIWAARMLSKWVDEDRTKWKTTSNRKGIPMEEEQKEKISESLKESYRNGRTKMVEKGSNLSAEHKAKISESSKGTQSGEKNGMWGKGKPISIDGVEYASIAEAARETGIHGKTIVYRINNKNKPTWYRL